MTKKPSSPKKLTRSQQRNLDIEIGFLEGVIRRDPHYMEALQLLGDDYTQRGRFVDGLKVDEQLARLRPADAQVHYNLACSCALTGQFEAAVEALGRAIDLGYRNFSWLSRDPDLAELREHPLYKKVRAKVRSLKLRAGQAR